MNISSIDEVLIVAEMFKFDVLLLCVPPDRNTCETLRKLRVKPGYETVPVVACAATDTEADDACLPDLDVYVTRPSRYGCARC